MSATATAVPALEIVRHFDAPPERVFDAWVGKGWGAWLPPRDAVCRVLSLDARPGGEFRLEMSMCDGRVIEAAGTYHVVDRPRLLVFEWHGGCNFQATTVTVRLRSDGERGTWMDFRQDGFDDAALRSGFEGGWGSEGGSFDKLAAWLGTGPG